MDNILYDAVKREIRDLNNELGDKESEKELLKAIYALQIKQTMLLAFIGDEIAIVCDTLKFRNNFKA